jgi:hypothetical protein
MSRLSSDELLHRRLSISHLHISLLLNELLFEEMNCRSLVIVPDKCRVRDDLQDHSNRRVAESYDRLCQWSHEFFPFDETINMPENKSLFKWCVIWLDVSEVEERVRVCVWLCVIVCVYFAISDIDACEAPLSVS